MPESQNSDQKHQSGILLAIGIVGFMVGLVVVLYLVKKFLGI